MDNKGKAAAAILGIGAVGGLIYALAKSKGEEGDGGEGGGELFLELYDQYGNRIASGTGGEISALPASVVEGTVVSAVLTVKNTSIKRTGTAPATVDTPIAANLWLTFNAYAAGAPGEAQIIWAPYVERQFSFAAGETKTITAAEWPALQFTVSLGANGIVVATLLRPDKSLLKSATKSLVVTAGEIIYGGEIILL